MGDGGRLCADWNAAGENVEAGVPAVSMARRRIERLQGVQFCRRTMEIRSEVSGPPDCVRGAWTEKEAFVRLSIFGSGGLGLRAKALSIFPCMLFAQRLRPRRALPAPAKEP